MNESYGNYFYNYFNGNGGGRVGFDTSIQVGLSGQVFVAYNYTGNMKPEDFGGTFVYSIFEYTGKFLAFEGTGSLTVAIGRDWITIGTGPGFSLGFQPPTPHVGGVLEVGVGSTVPLFSPSKPTAQRGFYDLLHNYMFDHPIAPLPLSSINSLIRN